MVDDIPITDTLKHIADDHPCCAGSLMQAVARIEELEGASRDLIDAFDNNPPYVPEGMEILRGVLTRSGEEQ